MTGHELKKLLEGFTEAELNLTVVISTSITIVRSNGTKRLPIIEDVASIDTMLSNLGPRLGITT